MSFIYATDYCTSLVIVQPSVAIKNGCVCYNFVMTKLPHEFPATHSATPPSDWQLQVCARVRALIHEADPAIEETVKRGDRPYFVLAGNVCALQTTKDHVNIFIYDPIAPDPHGIINQGQGNKTARAIQLYQNDQLDKPAFKELIKAIADNNRAGGWRKLRRAMLSS